VSIHSTPNIPSFIDDQTTLSSGTSHTTSFKTTTPLIQVCLGGTGNILFLCKRRYFEECW